MIKYLVSAYSRSLQRRFSAKQLDKIFRSLPSRAISQRDGIRLCALQVEAKTYRSAESWLRELDEILCEAVSRGASLICLPELYGLIPLFCHPLLPPLLKKRPGSISEGAGEGGMDLLPLLELFEPIFGTYEQIISRFAKRYGIYIFGGTAFIPEKGKIFNRGALISPEGEILARQDKLHLTVEEIALGLSTGEELKVVPTPIGNIALCVCMDATYFETFRIARNLGADYIIVPIGDMSEFDHYLALRGVQTRVNEAGLPALKPALVSGKDFPILFTGKAGIWFPGNYPYESQETENYKGSGMVITEVTLPGLREVKKSEPFLRENHGFARNYLNALIQYKEGGKKHDPKENRK